MAPSTARVPAPRWERAAQRLLREVRVGRAAAPAQLPELAAFWEQGARSRRARRLERAERRAVGPMRCVLSRMGSHVAPHPAQPAATAPPQRTAVHCSRRRMAAHLQPREHVRMTQPRVVARREANARAVLVRQRSRLTGRRLSESARARRTMDRLTTVATVSYPALATPAVCTTRTETTSAP